MKTETTYDTEAPPPRQDVAPQRRSRRHRLIYFYVLAMVAMVGVAGWLLAHQGTGSIPGFTSADPRAVAPAANSPAKVTGVRIEGRGNALELRRNGTGWQLASSHGYPVSSDKVTATLRSLGQLRTAYVSTSSPPPYASYGLTGTDDPTGRAVSITLSNSGGETVGSVTVGSSVSAPGNGVRRILTALMLPGDSRIWLAGGDLKILTDPVHWLDNHITDMPEGNILQIATTMPDGRHLALARAGAGEDLRVTDGLPPGTEIKKIWLLDDIAHILGHLRFLDVEKASAFAPIPAEHWQIDARTTRHVVFHLTLFTEDMGTWATIHAEATGRDGQAAATRFNQRHDGWAYLLDAYVARRLMTGSDTLTDTGTDSR